MILEGWNLVLESSEQHVARYGKILDYIVAKCFYKMQCIKCSLLKFKTFW